MTSWPRRKPRGRAIFSRQMTSSWRFGCGGCTTPSPLGWTNTGLTFDNCECCAPYVHPMPQIDSAGCGCLELCSNLFAMSLPSGHRRSVHYAALLLWLPQHFYFLCVFLFRFIDRFREPGTCCGQAPMHVRIAGLAMQRMPATRLHGGTRPC